MVGKEFNNGEIEGLFAATPPLEALRLILSRAATGDASPRGDATKGQQRKSVMIADVSRAFFEAAAKRDVCVELLGELLAAGETSQDTVGKLLASLHGTRDASANWQEEVAKCMKEWGFVMGSYSPCMRRHPSRDILCLVHGDDFVSVGCPEMVRWLKSKLQGRFEIKTTVVGSNEEEGEEKEARILNIIISVTNEGWEYGADQRRADLIVQEM